MRFACGDMRDHIVSYQNDHRPSYWLQRALRLQESLKSAFARFSASFDFCNNICHKQTFSTPATCAQAGMSVNRPRPPPYDARHARLIAPYEYDSRITLAPTAAIFFPGGVERSLTQKPWRPASAFSWNQSTSQTRSAPIGLVFDD